MDRDWDVIEDKGQTAIEEENSLVQNTEFDVDIDVRIAELCVVVDKGMEMSELCDRVSAICRKMFGAGTEIADNSMAFDAGDELEIFITVIDYGLAYDDIDIAELNAVSPNCMIYSDKPVSEHFYPFGESISITEKFK